MTTIIDGTAGVTFPAGGVGNPASAVVGLTDTQTLTNKSIVATQLTGTIAVARLPAGSVLQVVQGILTGTLSTSSATFVTTGLTASITPSSSSSKVLVFASCASTFNGSAGNQGSLAIYRNSTNLHSAFGAQFYGSASSVEIPVSMSILDSPSTTSSTAYTVYIKADSGTVNFSVNSGNNFIILMEIAA